ncbi:unnamed protein product [Meganyctiphanes norvegica]|uniref:RING-type domain-containing protein n=1 Tax=Meganyctiphanes norvegica TaxID=48144 RepID=A0AAV2QSN3_MEGNR
MSCSGCPVCLETYVEGVRDPVMLPQCGHTLCRPCLTAISPVTCPICRMDHQGPIPDHLPTNYVALNGALLSMKGSQNGKDYIHRVVDTTSTQPSAPLISQSHLVEIGTNVGIHHTTAFTDLIIVRILSMFPLISQSVNTTTAKIIVMVAFTILFAIPMSMICLGGIKWYDCPTQDGFIPIWLVVAGSFLIVLIFQGLKCLIQENPSVCWGYPLTLNIIFHFTWFIVGCIWIYGAYPTHYDESQNPNYCDYTLYMYSFWLLNLTWISLFFIIVTYVLYLIMSLAYGNTKKIFLMVASTIVLAIFLCMIVIASFKWSDCIVQPFIPIWLIVSSITGIFTVVHTSYFMLDKSSVCHGYLMTIQIIFHIAWFVTGCIWVFAIYLPNFDDLTNDNYCDYTLYMFTFWLLNLGFVALGIIAIGGAIYCFSKCI